MAEGSNAVLMSFEKDDTGKAGGVKQERKFQEICGSSQDPDGRRSKAEESF
jgi:hypothetical protein